MDWLTAMVVSRVGDLWDRCTEAEQVRVLRGITATVDRLPRDRFRVFRQVEGLDEQSGHDDHKTGRRRGATVIVSVSKHPQVRTKRDVLRLLRPLVQLGDKVNRGKVAERAVEVTLREANLQLQACDVKTERRVLGSLTRLDDWDRYVWDETGRRRLAVIEVKNLISLAVRLSQFRGLTERIHEAVAYGIGVIVVVPKATKQFCREVAELGGVVVAIGCYLVASQSHKARLEVMGLGWPVVVSAPVATDFEGSQGVGLPTMTGRLLLAAVRRELEAAAAARPNRLREPLGVRPASSAVY